MFLTKNFNLKEKNGGKKPFHFVMVILKEVLSLAIKPVQFVECWILINKLSYSILVHPIIHPERISKTS